MPCVIRGAGASFCRRPDLFATGDVRDLLIRTVAVVCVLTSAAALGMSAIGS